MTDEYEYFVEPDYETGMTPPGELWRRQGDTREYFSLIDWAWHPREPGDRTAVPLPHLGRHLTPHEASDLVANRQRWVRYWAEYLRPPSGPDDRPLTVVRRRSSPELVLDESYTIDNQWEQTPAVVEFENPGFASSPLHLVEIDRAAADRILEEVRGIPGTTEL